MLYNEILLLNNGGARKNMITIYILICFEGRLSRNLSNDINCLLSAMVASKNGLKCDEEKKQLLHASFGLI